MSQRNPNPQGKGLVPVLATLTESRAAAADIPPKKLEQISTELFTSLFILESDFKFKPVTGKTYWLYLKNKKFRLSPVAPAEWPKSLAGEFVGECLLHKDLTWTLELSDRASEDPELMKRIEKRHRDLEKQLQNAESMEDILPRYNESLAFYQRAFSYALAHSLRVSMTKAGILSLGFEEARSNQPKLR